VRSARRDPRGPVAESGARTRASSRSLAHQIHDPLLKDERREVGGGLRGGVALEARDDLRASGVGIVSGRGREGARSARRGFSPPLPGRLASPRTALILTGCPAAARAVVTLARAAGRARRAVDATRRFALRPRTGVALAEAACVGSGRVGSERRETEQGRAAMDAALDVDKGRLPALAARGRARSAPRSGRGRTMVDKDIPRASVRGDVRRAALIGGAPRAPTPVAGFASRQKPHARRSRALNRSEVPQFPCGRLVRRFASIDRSTPSRFRHFSSKSTLASPGQRVSEEARFVRSRIHHVMLARHSSESGSTVSAEA
jgi:hypothetical protein